MNDLARTSLMFVVGLAGGLTGALLFGGDAGPAGAGAGVADDGAEARTIRTLEERILALEGAAESQRLAYDELDGRLLALSRRPDFEQIMAAADAAAAAAAAGSSSAGFGPAGSAVAAEARAVYEQIEAEKEAERQAEQAKRRDERIAAQAERVSTELGLDASQTKVIKDAITESWTAREAVFAEIREGGGQPMDREVIGQKMSELRAIEIETVSKVLTPAQVEQYSSLTSFGGRGFGGDGGRGRNEGDRAGRTEGGRGGF